MWAFWGALWTKSKLHKIKQIEISLQFEIDSKEILWLYFAIKLNHAIREQFVIN